MKPFQRARTAQVCAATTPIVGRINSFWGLFWSLSSSLASTVYLLVSFLNVGRILDTRGGMVGEDPFLFRDPRNKAQSSVPAPDNLHATQILPFTPGNRT